MIRSPQDLMLKRKIEHHHTRSYHKKRKAEEYKEDSNSCILVDASRLLPKDILAYCFDFLTTCERILGARLVNRYWQLTSRTPIAWKHSIYAISDLVFIQPSSLIGLKKLVCNSYIATTMFQEANWLSQIGPSIETLALRFRSLSYSPYDSNNNHIDPFRMFSVCSNVKQLDIGYFMVNIIAILTVLQNKPMLEKLTLKIPLETTDQDIDTIMALCPLLQELSIQGDISTSRLQQIVNSQPNLYRLAIEDYWNRNVWPDSVCQYPNITSLRCKWMCFDVVVFAMFPNLVSLELFGAQQSTELYDSMCWSKLESLKLSYWKSGTLSLEKATKLKKLHLTQLGCMVTAEEIQTFSMLSELESFVFVGKLHKSIFGLLLEVSKKLSKVINVELQYFSTFSILNLLSNGGFPNIKSLVIYKIDCQDKASKSYQRLVQYCMDHQIYFICS